MPQLYLSVCRRTFHLFVMPPLYIDMCHHRFHLFVTPRLHKSMCNHICIYYACLHYNVHVLPKFALIVHAWTLCPRAAIIVRYSSCIDSTCPYAKMNLKSPREEIRACATIISMCRHNFIVLFMLRLYLSICNHNFHLSFMPGLEMSVSNHKFHLLFTPRLYT